MLPQGWAALVALLDGQPDVDPMTRAQRLCGLCVESAAVTGASLAVRTEDHRSLVCATDNVSDRLEQLQLTYSEGPCVDAGRDGWLVQEPDLTNGPTARWPWYSPAAVEAGALAVFAVPVQVGAIRLGVLSLYRVTAGALDGVQFSDLWVLAEAASVLMTVGADEDASQSFLWAVDDGSRFHAEVHQAVGVLTVQLGVRPQTALARLRAHAFSTNRPIAEVAADVLAKRLTLDSE